ncbi:hypothetical protein [Prevotella pallens]|nr:hypothetical protein [Prevotella pallens]
MERYCHKKHEKGTLFYAHYAFTKVENPLYKQVNNLFVRFFMVGVKPC